MSETIKEFAIANITRVDFITQGDEPKTYSLVDVASEAESIAYLSEGEEKVLRVKNTIKAQNNTEDIVLGYDNKFVNATLIPEILALVDGGELVYGVDGEEDVVKEYIAPELGKAVERQPFTTKVYTEEKDGDGSTVSYVCFEYKNCKGTPVNYTLQDGEFYAPELNIKSRSKLGERPMKVSFLKELPE